MSESPPVKTFFGLMLILVGGLWVLLAGGCTLVFLGGALFQGSSSSAAEDAVSLLSIGAVCIAPGAVMLWIGWRMVRTPADS